MNGTSTEDFKKLRKVIIALNKEDYEKFMKFFKGSSANKDYYKRLRFYKEIGRKVEILKNLKLDNGEVIIDPHDI